MQQNFNFFDDPLSIYHYNSFKKEILFSRQYYSEICNSEKYEKFEKRIDVSSFELESSYLALKVRSFILDPMNGNSFSINDIHLEKAHEKAITYDRTIFNNPTQNDLLILLGSKFDSNSSLNLLISDIVKSIIMLQYSLLDFKGFKFVVENNYVPLIIQQKKERSGFNFIVEYLDSSLIVNDCIIS